MLLHPQEVPNEKKQQYWTDKHKNKHGHIWLEGLQKRDFSSSLSDQIKIGEYTQNVYCVYSVYSSMQSPHPFF